MSVRDLKSEELVAAIRGLLGDERIVQTEFLLHLAEFNRRRGWEALGHASLWDYCRKELGLLECAAFRRIHAARLLATHPQAAEYLRDGRLSMTSLVMLEPILTMENATRLFDAAAGMSKREIEYLIACEQRPLHAPSEEEVPLGMHPDDIAVPIPAPIPAPGSEPVADSGEAAVQAFAGWVAAKRDAARAAAAETDAQNVIYLRPDPVPDPIGGTLTPTGEDRYRVTLTVDAAFVALLESATSVLSHAEPGRNPVEVIRRGLAGIVERHERRMTPKAPKSAKAPKTSKAPKEPPTSTREKSSSRSAKAPADAVPATPHIPSAVKREVWARDGGRCAWRRKGGGVCGSTDKLEFDHIVPKAKGGLATVANIRLLCRAHNAQHARECFGESWMAQFTKKPAAPSSAARITSPGRSNPRMKLKRSG